jgi:hypothetical protein
MKFTGERYQGIEINGMKFQAGEDALHPSPNCRKALAFLKGLPDLFDNPNRSRFYTEPVRTRDGVCLPYKNIPGCKVSREKYKVDASRGVPSRTETPCMTLEIEFPESFFDSSADCRNCRYMEPDNRGFCSHPSREDSDGDSGFSEVTAQREVNNDRCWCENYEAR